MGTGHFDPLRPHRWAGLPERWEFTVGRRQPAPDGATRWVAGVGWVVESADHIPATARWVPGVGYVVED